MKKNLDSKEQERGNQEEEATWEIQRKEERKRTVIDFGLQYVFICTD